MIWQARSILVLQSKQERKLKFYLQTSSYNSRMTMERQQVIHCPLISILLHPLCHVWTVPTDQNGLQKKTSSQVTASSTHFHSTASDGSTLRLLPEHAAGLVSEIENTSWSSQGPACLLNTHSVKMLGTSFRSVKCIAPLLLNQKDMIQESVLSSSGSLCSKFF